MSQLNNVPTPAHLSASKACDRSTGNRRCGGKQEGRPFPQATSSSQWISILLLFPCGKLRLNFGECCVQNWRWWVLGLGPHHQSAKETISLTFLEEGPPALMVALPVPLVSDVSGVPRGMWGSQHTQALGTCLPLLNSAKLWGNFHRQCSGFCGKNGEFMEQLLGLWKHVLSTLNLHSAVCPLYLKTGRGKNRSNISRKWKQDLRTTNTF